MELEVNGARIAYEIFGKEGEWITLINGYTRGKSDFKFLAQKLAGSGRRVLVFDNRGSGDSEVYRPFTMDDMVDDVLRLWEHECIENSVLLGISMGGFIAQELLRKSNKPSKLILVSSAARRAAVSRGAPWGDTPESITLALNAYFSQKYLQENPKIPLGMAKQILEKVRGGRFQDNAKLQGSAIAGFDLKDVRENSLVPVLVIHGGEDRIIPLGEAKIMADRFRNGQITVFALAGHLLLAESPVKLHQTILDFLN